MVTMSCKRESNNPHPWRQIILLLLVLQISAANGPTSNVQVQKMHYSITASPLNSNQERPRDNDEDEHVPGGLVVGSRPPICDHKCGECVPCAAIQVPTHASGLNAVDKHSNYEPERWKCECESSFYDP